MKTATRHHTRRHSEPEPIDGTVRSAAAPAGAGLDADLLDQAIARARAALLAEQHPDGYWCYELEADCTIPAEYVLMMHFMDEIDTALERQIGNYLRARQADHGGWPLYTHGDFDISCSVKAYFALKAIGDSPDAPHMVRAREAILSHGGAARSNVFTRLLLAMFGQIPWRGVPFVPVEIMLFPRWFPFHLTKVSYWSRTVMVPLTILCSLKARARNPRNVDIRELFVTPPEQERHYFQIRSPMNRVFQGLDWIGRKLEPFIPKAVRRRAIRKAEAWFIERLNGDGGLGAIFPAMVNAYEALDLLGYDRNHPLVVQCRESIRKLLVVRDDEAYCQPCVSPVWDTALAAYALQEADGGGTSEPVQRALDWLKPRQLIDRYGDWQELAPGLVGGGWPFQFFNDHYPDLDDTAVVAWTMHRTFDFERYGENIRYAADWLAGMQSRNGGFAAFDIDNCYYYLNEIPFADHGALLDPPTSDVTARCVGFLSRLDPMRYRRTVERAIAFLRSEQEANGSWFGRWGTNYIYGTWSVLMAFAEAGVPNDDPAVQRAVAWLEGQQQEDGGWGESNDTYIDPGYNDHPPPSTSFQTAWALIALMSVGRVDTPAVQRGIAFLLERQRETGLWDDGVFTAPGFPRVFYLKYYGYDRYFPLWALGTWRRLTQTAAR